MDFFIGGVESQEDRWAGVALPEAGWQSVTTIPGSAEDVDGWESLEGSLGASGSGLDLGNIFSETQEWKTMRALQLEP